MNFIKAIFSPPQFAGDESKTHQAFLLNIILWTLIAMPIPYVIFASLLTPDYLSRAMTQAVFGETVNITLVWLAHRGYVRAASIIQVAMFWLFFTFSAISGSNVVGTSYLLGYSLSIVIAGVLLGGKAALVTTMLSILSGLGMLFSLNSGKVTIRFIDDPDAIWVMSALFFPIIAVLQYLAERTLRQALKRAQKELIERQSAEKKLLRLNAISRSISTLQDLENVFETIYNELCQALPLNLFLLCLYDSRTNRWSYPYIVEDGQRVYEPSASKKPGTLFDRVVTNGEIILMNRTSEELAEWNAAMESGKASYIGSSRASASMMYVPMIAQNEIIGLISVQSFTLMAYDENSLEFLKNVSLQATIAIQNARLFEAQQQELIERTAAEQKLQESLQEKEVLLKEIHHRVKNNMQVVVSLMNLQAGYINDPAMLSTLRESQNRVQTMALVHEKLYQSQNLAQIDFRDYLQQLTYTLFNSYRSHTSKIELVFDIADVKVGVDAAIPCGLIINELVSNVLKHAFPNASEGAVKISLKELDKAQLEMVVEDNGVGFPVNKNWRQTESLGMQLVQSLVKQLNGTIDMQRLYPGSCFIIRFNQVAGK